MPELPNEGKLVVRYAGHIAKTMTTGGVLALTAIGARALGVEEVSYGELSVPLSLLWVIFVLGTCIHVFYTKAIINSLGNIVHTGGGEVKDAHATPPTPVDPETRKAMGDLLFNEIRTSPSRFLEGLIRRNQPIKDGSRFAGMSWTDPTTWITLGILIATVVAILPWHFKSGFQFAPWKTLLAYGVIAAIIVGINWFAGGFWIVNISHFGNEETVSGLRRVPVSSALSFKNFHAPILSQSGTLVGLCALGVIIVICIGIWAMA